MKSVFSVLSLGLPLAAAIATFSLSGSAFAQITNLPFAGTVSGTVFGTGSATPGAIALNSYSLLSPIGTISATTGTITSLTSSNGLSINLNSVLNATGTTTGGVVFNGSSPAGSGATASFVAAPTTVTGTVTSISGALTIGAPPVANTNLTVNVTTGNIQIPTSSIVAPPIVPISTQTVIVQSPGIASALVVLDPAFIGANPGVTSKIVTAFSPESAVPGAVYTSSLSCKISPFVN